MKHSQLNFLKVTFILFSVLFAFMNNVHGQNDYSFVFQEQRITIPENIKEIELNTQTFTSTYDNNIYAWMQFYELPLQENQESLKNSGVELIDYISNRTYLVKFNSRISKDVFIRNGVRGLISVSKEMKIASQLRNKDFNPWALVGNQVKLTVILYSGQDMDKVFQEFKNRGIQILTHYKGYPILEVLVSQSEISSLGEIGFVKWVEEIAPPAEKEDTRGRSLHRSNSLDTQTPNGRNYTGLGVGVLVRDDGIVGPHIDFQGRIDNSTATGTGQTHGDGVAGILTGAGNLDPTKRGMAAGSNVYVSNFTSNFLDAATTTRIANGSVQITNSSYGEGCNGGYTTNAVTVDAQMISNPNLLHVFSCGNSGTSNCNYGAGAGWGNITGGHKQGKNVIATANTFYNGSLASSSSKGPAHDGRIKPDITANGQNQLSTNENNTYLSFGGTSGASPGIAGISAQLYEAYMNLNAGALPPSALIKATLLNTANDAGNTGPDFRFGWGIVNGLRAALLIEEGRYLNNTITQGNNNNHTIAVPAGTKQVRFMVYWADPAATNGASTALINDLDLVVTSPSSTTYLPWILNPAPNATTLNAPATTGADHLNNMEQVLINNPSAGNYTININGFSVPMGPQTYYVVYEIITDDITVTYPNMGESFVPGEQETIHWDAPASNGAFTLEYSVNNGSSWNNIASVSSTLRNYDWTVPNNVSGNALIRITRGSASDVSDSVFSIAPLVTGQSITQVCPTSVTFSWNPVANAQTYEVFALGTQYMQSIGTSTTTSFVHTVTNPNAPIWYAVVAKNNTLGWKSRRTIASFYAGGLLNCTFSFDAGIVSIDNIASDFSSLCNATSVGPTITVLNSGSSAISNFPISYQLSGQPIVTETFSGGLSQGQQATYTFNTPLVISVTGNFTLSCLTSLSGDANTTNDTINFSFYSQSTATSAPAIEDFEAAGFLPNGWTLVNPDNNETWEEASVTGVNGAATQAAFINSYSYNAIGEEDYFETEIYNLSGTLATLTFDLAKAQYSATYNDSLAVQISADCGTSWSTIYAKAGNLLSTVSDQTANWSPTNGSQWRNEIVDISNYLGQDVSFKFISINGYSNSTYIDNINVTSNLSLNENLNIQIGLYPNPTTGEITISIENSIQKEIDVLILNSIGQVVKVISANDFSNTKTTLDLSNFANGVYFVQVIMDNGTAMKRLIKR